MADSETQTTNDFKNDEEYSNEEYWDEEYSNEEYWDEEYSEEVDEAANLLIEVYSNALALWGAIDLEYEPNLKEDLAKTVKPALMHNMSPAMASMVLCTAKYAIWLVC